MDLMEFVIKNSALTAFTALVAVMLSNGFLSISGLYKSRRATIIASLIFAVIAGSIWLVDYPKIGTWLFCTLATMVLAPPWVASICYRKDLKERGYH